MGLSAERNGYLVAYPAGWRRSWNSGPVCCRPAYPSIDDVGFLTEMVRQIGQTYQLDSRRVYAAGMSNGGNMAYRLACHASDVFAAVVSVAGASPWFTDFAENCNATRPVSVMQFHGTADEISPYEGGASSQIGWL
eukprot:TRINITY_DN149_c0_g1_i3.p1 TRINITY_DN149_c0_g1~~TRINITY_DN149_c0_g1_i3.p1  ORF type:complete len:136 (-),score=12.84 TRINITY_DN149_c0_g1_i3:374-781(-)